MILTLITNSFWAMAFILCAVFYADFALTIWGQKLYLAKGREHQVIDAYELNPDWRRIVEQGSYWNPKLLRIFAVMFVLAGLLWFLGAWSPVWIDWMSGTCIAIAQGAFVLVVSMYATVIGLHLRNIYIYAHLTRPELISGRVHASPQYSYGVTIITAVTAAAPLVILAVFQPSPATVGFALGPLLLAFKVRQMAARSAKLADQSQTAEEHSPDEPSQA